MAFDNDNTNQGILSALKKELVENRRARKQEQYAIKEYFRSTFTDSMRTSMHELLKNRQFNESKDYTRQRRLLREFQAKEQKAQTRVDKMKDRNGFEEVGLMDVLNPAKWREAVDQVRSENNRSIAGKLMAWRRDRKGIASVDNKVMIKAHKNSDYSEVIDVINSAGKALGIEKLVEQQEQEKRSSKGKRSKDDDHASEQVVQHAAEISQSIQNVEKHSERQTVALESISSAFDQGLTINPKSIDDVASKISISVNDQIVKFLKPLDGAQQTYSVEDAVEARQMEKTKLETIKQISIDVKNLTALSSSKGSGGKGGFLKVAGGIMAALGAGLSVLPSLLTKGVTTLFKDIIVPVGLKMVSSAMTALIIPLIFEGLGKIKDAAAATLEKISEWFSKPKIQVKTQTTGGITTNKGQKTNAPQKAPDPITAEKDKDKVKKAEEVKHAEKVNKLETPDDKDIKNKSKTNINIKANALSTANKVAESSDGFLSKFGRFVQSGARTVIRNAKGIPYVGTAAAAIEAGMTGLNIMYDRNQIDKDIAAGKISQEDGERLKAQITAEKGTDAAIDMAAIGAGAAVGGAIGQTLIPIPGVGWVVGSAVGSLAGMMGADTVKGLDMVKDLKNKFVDFFWSKPDDSVTAVKQQTEGERMRATAASQDNRYNPVVNVNTQNNTSNTAVNQGGIPQGPISTTDDLRGVRNYAYPGNFIGTD